MDYQPIYFHKARKIIHLHTQGMSVRKIAGATRSSRRTIRKWQLHFTSLNTTWEELSKLTEEEFNKVFTVENPVLHISPLLKEAYKYFPHVEKQLKRKDMTILKLWEEYAKSHPQGYKHSTFYLHYRAWKKRSQPTLRIEHKVGDKMFVDYAGDKLKILVDAYSGKLIETEVFVAILGASQLTYVEAVESQTVEDFILSCENALHYFTGAPLAIVTDNLKSAVTKSNRYEPKLNEQFEAFADYYGMAVIPARAYKPKDKALVEGAVNITYKRIYSQLKGESFVSMDALNIAITKHLEVHNTALFSGRDYSRRSQFEEIEKAELQTLPTHRFELRKQVMVTVMKNGHVSLSEDKHYYSVPHHFIGRKVKLMYSKSHVEVYYKYELITTHVRVNIPYRYTTLPEHLVRQHRFTNDLNPEYFLKQARSIHPDVASYIEQVISRKAHLEQAYKSCQGILSFAKKTSPKRLIGACQRAHQVGWYNFRIIENILQRGLDKCSADEENLCMPVHENIRGGDYYK